MKLKERIAVTRRGYRMLAEYCPKLIRTKVIAAAAEALSPFVTIWFSGRIINEITGNRDIGTLVLLVLLTVGLSFAFSMISNALNRVISEKESRMWNDFTKIFTDKQMKWILRAWRIRRSRSSARRCRKTCSCSATAWAS